MSYCVAYRVMEHAVPQRSTARVSTLTRGTDRLIASMTAARTKRVPDFAYRSEGDVMDTPSAPPAKRAHRLFMWSNIVEPREMKASEAPEPPLALPWLQVTIAILHASPELLTVSALIRLIGVSHAVCAVSLCYQQCHYIKLHTVMITKSGRT